MSEKIKENLEKEQRESTGDAQEPELSPTWAQDALADLEDWIEEQGIYLRQ